MSTPDIWQQLEVFDRTDDLRAAIEQLAALEVSLAAIDREAEPDAPLIGDLYSEVANDALADGDTPLARRLQARAAELPATEPARELGTHLGYLENDAPGTGAEQLAAARAGAEPADEPILLSAFAEAIEANDTERAEALHDEALALATAIPDGDPTTVAIPRALLRSELGREPDEYDELAERALEEIRELSKTADDVLAEAAHSAQLFVPRDQLDAAIAAWPDDAEEAGLNDPNQYVELDQLCGRMQTASGHGILLQPLNVELMQAHGVDITTDPADYPEAFSAAVDQESPAISWPPGRNEPCWCGSGQKYKRCCLS